MNTVINLLNDLQHALNNTWQLANLEPIGEGYFAPSLAE